MILSIILTVYNKEPYLQRALDALLLQDVAKDDDYEVLAINDGSTDGSAAILDEYAQRDKRVRILTQQNQGLSMARNNGVIAARGNYVWFVDSDDIISAKSVRLICDATQMYPDVIPIYARTEGLKKVRNAVSPAAKTGKDILLGGHWEQCGVFWIFRKDFLKENGLRFLPGVYHEDAEFTPRMLYTAKSIKVVPEILYTVIHEPNSITGVPRPKRAFDCLTVVDSLNTFMEKNKLKGTDCGRAITSQAALLINNGFDIIVKNNKSEQDSFDDVIISKAYLIDLLMSAPHWKYRLEALLFGLFPGHYVRIYKLLKRIR